MIYGQKNVNLHIQCFAIRYHVQKQKINFDLGDIMPFGVVFIQIFKIICSHCHNFSLYFVLFRLLYLVLLPPLYYHHLHHHHHCHNRVVVTVARWNLSTNSHLQHSSNTRAMNWAQIVAGAGGFPPKLADGL